MTGNEAAPKYLAACLEHLATIEADLLQIKLGMWTKDRDLVNRVSRTMHSFTPPYSFSTW